MLIITDKQQNYEYPHQNYQNSKTIAGLRRGQQLQFFWRLVVVESTILFSDMTRISILQSLNDIAILI